MVMTGSHDSVLVSLSVLIAVVASYTALDLAGRIRVSVGRARTAWLATAAVAMGGGIWAVHFVGMLAFGVPGVPTRYDIGLAVLSLAVAIGATGFGFIVIGSARRPRPGALVVGGVVTGLAIAAMHVMGVAAMRLQAQVSYDKLWMAVSVVIAVGTATGALALAHGTRSPVRRLVAALVMGCAIAGIHFAVMRASVVVPTAEATDLDAARRFAGTGQGRLAIAIAAFTFLVLLLALMAALFDRRYGEAQNRLRRDLRAAYERQGLMLSLVERMRVLDSPDVIMSEVAAALGGYLKIDRAGFFRVRNDDTVDYGGGACWSAGRLPLLTGTRPTAAYGETMNVVSRSGGTVAFADAQADPQNAVFLKIGTRARLGVAMTRGGRWQAGFYCHHGEVRPWSRNDISLVEDIASLAWDAVERAEARLQLKGLNEVLEARVAEQTRDIRMITDALPVLIAFVDDEFVYRFANAAYKDWFDFTPEQVVGNKVQDIFTGEQYERRRAYLERALAGEDVTFELAWPRPDGRSRVGEIRYLPRTRSDGTVDGFYIFVQDVTERAEATERLKSTNIHLEHEVEERKRDLVEAEERLRQSQKMEAVGQLTGGLAHDFNNLLTGVSGSLELLQRRVDQGRFGELERYIGTAQEAARRAAALTHRLLAFSRRQTLAPKVTDVNALVTEMLDLIRRTVGPAIEVEAIGVIEGSSALVDPNQLENALLNLCINARDAMPDGGKITIETAHRWLDDRAARKQDMPAGAYVSLSVADTGTGMAPEVIERAFDPFFTTKPIGEGTGLGLSMIYGFARQSGGQARIRSTVGEGTTVSVYLPRDEAPATDIEAPSDMAAAPRAERGETVLVVDDEPTVRMLVAEVLEDLGYLALEAIDGASGLRVLESDIRIDLLVTDVGLPGGMNGRQMADRARVTRPELNVLFITGYAENAAVGPGNLDPGMQVLTKPFTVEALASRMKDMIALDRAA